MKKLTQLGRYQRSAAERLVIRTAVEALGALAMVERDGLVQAVPELEQIFDTLYLCLEVLSDYEEKN